MKEIKSLTYNQAIHCPTPEIFHTILIMFYGSYILGDAESAWSIYKENTIWFPHRGMVQNMLTCDIPSFSVLAYSCFTSVLVNSAEKHKEFSHYNI